MLTIISIVFAAAFGITVMVLMAVSARASEAREQTMVRLQSIAVAPQEVRPPDNLDIMREEVLSNIPWLNELMKAADISPAMRKVIRQANLEWTLSSIVLGSIVLGVGSALLIYLRTGALLVSLAIGFCLGSIPWMMVLRARKKRFAAFEEKLPEALDLVVSALRAGHGFTNSIGLVAKEAGEPIASEFRQVFDEQNFGLDLRVAMNNLSDRVPITDVNLIVSAVLIQRDSGGNLAEILEKAAIIIRERFRLRRQIRVNTAQGRLTGWILALAPVVLGVLMYLLDPQRVSMLWTRPLGVKLLWAAVIMDVIGALIIRKIVRTPV